MKRMFTTVTLAAMLTSVLLVAAPAQVASGKAKKIDAGGYTSCAIVGKGSVKCWGAGTVGELGNGDTQNSNVPVAVTGITDAKQISTSESPCAVLKSGVVKCWGAGGSGELGNGHDNDKSVPVRVRGISNAKQVSAGYLHSCAVLETGQIKCWGNDSHGELGNGGGNSNSNVPVLVKNISNAVQVDAGNEYHTCAKLATSKVKCWGDNRDGQLGDDSTDDSGVPVNVVQLGKVRRVITGYFETCAIMPDSHVKCWGDNSSGELGIGTTGGNYDTPQDVVNLAGVKKMSHENDNACAVLSSGRIKCWGDNGSGQFGDGTTDPSDSPVKIAGISNVKAVTAGWYHTCILFENNVTKCTGDGGNGELGQGAFASSLTYVKALV